LLQADGHRDLEMDVNQGDGTDLFGATPGIAVSAESAAHTREWDGRESGLVISDISAPGEVISFVVGEGSPVQTVTGQASPMVTIPDNQTTGVSSTIRIGASGTVARIVLGVDVQHSYVGDLRVELTSPSGRRAVLHAQIGGSSDNLVTSYDSASPGVLTNMVGQSMLGDWILTVSDRARQDVGQLRSWSLELTSAAI
jgi:subtilisin-like proprotein convertase family protein